MVPVKEPDLVQYVPGLVPAVQSHQECGTMKTLVADAKLQLTVVGAILGLGLVVYAQSCVPVGEMMPEDVVVGYNPDYPASEAVQAHQDAEDCAGEFERLDLRLQVGVPPSLSTCKVKE